MSKLFTSLSLFIMADILTFCKSVISSMSLSSSPLSSLHQCRCHLRHFHHFINAVVIFATFITSSMSLSSSPLSSLHQCHCHLRHFHHFINVVVIFATFITLLFKLSLGLHEICNHCQEQGYVIFVLSSLYCPCIPQNNSAIFWYVCDPVKRRNAYATE